MPKQQRIAVPKTVEEAAALERTIGELIRAIRSHEDSFEKQREALDKKEDELIHPLQQEVLASAKSLYAFANAHRPALTESGQRKSATLGTSGSVQWYTTPAAVDIENVADVLDRIKKLGFNQFIRTKEEINKEALLENEALAATIQGVRIQRQDKFAIKPRGVKERVECNTKTKRWKITLPAS